MGMVPHDPDENVETMLTENERLRGMLLRLEEMEQEIERAKDALAQAKRDYAQALAKSKRVNKERV